MQWRGDVRSRCRIGRASSCGGARRLLGRRPTRIFRRTGAEAADELRGRGRDSSGQGETSRRRLGLSFHFDFLLQ